VVAGMPEEVAKYPTSHTGRYLKPELAQHPAVFVEVSGWCVGGGVGEGLGVAWVEAWRGARGI